MKDTNTIQVGQWFTVADWVGQTDRSWVGDVLKVQAIDWPFIVAQEFKYGTKILAPFKLDLPRVEVRPISDEYVRELAQVQP